jgi:hypothetical protein
MQNIDEWKESLLALKDTVFFDLMRSSLGDLKTPFNKQRLIEQLRDFLAGKEVQETIRAFIDERDHTILAAINILGDCGVCHEETLAVFFAGEYDYFEIAQAVVNLEERLILYRPHSLAKKHLAINPVLMPALNDIINDCSILFPAFPCKHTTNNAVQALADNRFPAFLCAFISSNGCDGLPVKSGGELRKKEAALSQALFPGLDTEKLFSGLVETGLCTLERECLFPNYDNMTVLVGLEAKKRAVFFAACLCRGRSLVSQHLSTQNDGADDIHVPASVRLTAGLLHAYLHVLEKNVEAGFAFTKNALFRMYQVVLLHYNFNEKSVLWPAFNTVFSVLTSLGVFVKAAAKPHQVSADEPSLWKLSVHTPKISEGGPFIAFDSNLSYILYPEISAEDALELAIFSTPCLKETRRSTLDNGKNTSTGVAASLTKEANIAHSGVPITRFEITRDSLVRAFDMGKTPDDIIGALRQLSGNKVEAATDWTVSDCHRRYRDVTIFDGPLLILSPERRYLARPDGPLSSFIVDSPTPGIYILRGGSVLGGMVFERGPSGKKQEDGDIISALQKAGVDIIAQNPKEKVPSVCATLSPEGLIQDNAFATEKLTFTAKSAGDTAGATGMETVAAKKLLLNVLKKRRFSEREQEEIADRIEKRFIVHETQIASIPESAIKVEARGLDYAGKLNIAKQAVTLHRPVEITFTAADGTREVLSCRLLSMEKNGGDVQLVIADNQVEKKLPIGKVSIIRLLRQSIFA